MAVQYSIQLGINQPRRAKGEIVNCWDRGSFTCGWRMHIFMHGIILAPATSTELNGETALFKVQRWHFATITLLLICTPEYYYRTLKDHVYWFLRQQSRSIAMLGFWLISWIVYKSFWYYYWSLEYISPGLILSQMVHWSIWKMNIYGCKHALTLGWDQAHLLQLSLSNATQHINI